MGLCLLCDDFATMTEMQDTRNVIDKFKGRSEAEIVKELDAKDHGLVIALENTEQECQCVWCAADLRHRSAAMEQARCHDDRQISARAVC